MILASGARGPGFNSRNSPFAISWGCRGGPQAIAADVALRPRGGKACSPSSNADGRWPDGLPTARDAHHGALHSIAAALRHRRREEHLVVRAQRNVRRA